AGSDEPCGGGTTCGGILDILVGPVSKQAFPELGEIATAVERREPVAVATVISGPGKIGARRVIWGDASRASTGGLGAGGRLGAAGDGDGGGRLGQGPTRDPRCGGAGRRRA